MNVLNLTNKDKANEQCYKVLEYLNKKKISDNFFLSFLAKLFDSNQIQSIYSKYMARHRIEGFQGIPASPAKFSSRD